MRILTIHITHDRRFNKMILLMSEHGIFIRMRHHSGGGLRTRQRRGQQHSIHHFAYKSVFRNLIRNSISPII